MLGVLLVVGLLAGAGMPMIEKASRAAQVAVGDTGARLERVLGAFRAVKAAGTEAREIAAIDRGAEDAWRAGVRSARWESLVHGSNTLAISWTRRRLPAGSPVATVPFFGSAPGNPL